MWIERELKLRGVESELPKLDWVPMSRERGWLDSDRT